MTHVECLFEVPQVFYIDGLLHLVYLLRSLAHQGGTAAASPSWLWNATLTPKQAASCGRCGVVCGLVSHTPIVALRKDGAQDTCVCTRVRGENVLWTPISLYRAVMVEDWPWLAIARTHEAT